MTGRLAGLSERKLQAALRASGLSAAAAKAVLGRRPFPDDAALCAAAEAVLVALDDAALPRALEAVGEPAVEQGDPDVRDAAALALRLYRERFAYPFVSAIATTSADELLMRVRIRLGNEPVPEGRAAREHLRRIVRSRLQALIQGES